MDRLSLTYTQRESEVLAVILMGFACSSENDKFTILPVRVLSEQSCFSNKQALINTTKKFEYSLD